MEAMTIEVVIQQIRAVPGVLAADIRGERLCIKVADRDLFPVRRRVAAWLARCAVSVPDLRWELDRTESCGAYDPMERAISTMGYRPANATGYPADD